jgi:transglutaminase-like putative cysteine protease
VSQLRNRTATAQIAIAAAACTWATLFAWVGFTEEPARFLVPSLVIAILVTVLGILVRNWGASGFAVLTSQAALTSLAVFLLVSERLIPGRDAVAALLDAFADAAASARIYPSPVPADVPGVHPLLIAGAALCFLLVDLLAATWQRVALIGLPLLTIFLLPAALNGTPVSPWVFVVGASGYLLVLFLNQARLIAGWGRPLDELEPGATGIDQAPTRQPPAARAAMQGAGITAIAILFALSSSLVVPSWDLPGWGFGPGAGRGSEELTIESPLADFRRDLLRGPDNPMLSLRTTDPSPGYLRIAVLNRFGSNAWTSGDRNFPDDPTAHGQELPLAGLSPQLDRQDFAYTIRTTEDFDSSWLPTPFPSTRVNASGAWKYDENTMDFFAADDELNAADMTYTATGLDVELDARELVRSPSGSGAVSSMYTSVPENLPDLVSTLADEVTQGAPSKFEKAVALQTWFRRDDNFRYSLEVAPGSGGDDLVAFLSPGEGGRVGYCEQFASAMAVMARTLDIPARVAIGFLSPDRVTEDVWAYSAWDLHAWPELYFQGAGWVRFEPTPSSRAGQLPDYTTQNLPAPAPTPSVAPDPSDAAPSSGTPRPEGPTLPDEPVATQTQESSSWPMVSAVLAGGLLIAALLLAPRAIRASRRRRRWHEALAEQLAPEAAWAELQDTVIDLRRRWPGGLSPNATRQRLITWFGEPVARRRHDSHRPTTGQNPAAVEAMDRIVRAVEESRYAAVSRRFDAAALRADVEVCAAALSAGSTPRARRLAIWWPASALRRSRPWRGDPSAGRGDPANAVVVQTDEEVLDRIG